MGVTLAWMAFGTVVVTVAGVVVAWARRSDAALTALDALADCSRLD